MLNLKSLQELFSSYFKHVLILFFNKWVILLSNEISSEKIFYILLDEKQPGIMVWGIFPLLVSKYNMS